MISGSFESVVEKIAKREEKDDFLFHQSLDLELVNRVFRDRTFKSIGLLENASIEVINDQYLNGIKAHPGVLLVRSAKNTGKTASLAELLEDRDQSVLFVGHRITLLRQASSKFGLAMYSDTNADEPRFAVTMDSLWRANRRRIFDYVVIDESEQVLNHLFSEPMLGRQNVALRALQFHLKRAKHIIALDADLDWPTLNFFGSFAKPAEGLDLRLVLNQYRKETSRSLKLHSKIQGLDDAILHAATTREHIFVVSDDRGYVDRTYKRLTSDAKIPPAKVLKVTSETSDQPRVREFLGNPGKNSHQYRAILASPSISSGLDISFDDHEIVFGRVFGAFFGHHFTHLECDQQLARVRDPGRVDVFIQNRPPARTKPKQDDDDFFDLEPLEKAVSIAETVQLFVVKAVRNLTITGYADDGSEMRELNHPLEQIAQDLLPPRFFSRQHLKANFVDHMKEQGWSIEKVASALPEPYEPVSPEVLLKRVLEVSKNETAKSPSPGDLDAKAHLASWLLQKANLLNDGVWRKGDFSKLELTDFASECLSKKNEIKSILGFTVKSDVKGSPVLAISSLLKVIGVSKKQKKTNRNKKTVLIYTLDL